MAQRDVYQAPVLKDRLAEDHGRSDDVRIPPPGSVYIGGKRMENRPSRSSRWICSVAVPTSGEEKLLSMLINYRVDTQNGERSLPKRCLISQTFSNGDQYSVVRTTPAGFQENYTVPASPGSPSTGSTSLQRVPGGSARVASAELRSPRASQPNPESTSAQ